MTNHVVIICPYFGTINKAIHTLWLQGCAANPNIRFLLLTDDEDALHMPMPQNVEGVFMRWDDCVALAKSKFEFEVALNDPYKLCDLKPAYGYVFSDYLEGCAFWGHLDNSDTILGDLRKFITDDVLSAYDKVHSFGHLTLYRNTPEANMRFSIPPTCGTTIQELFSRSEVIGFDEMNHPWSINTIYKENGFSLLERIPDLVVDLQPDSYHFRIAEDNGIHIPRVLEWDHGRLYEITVQREANIAKREVGYVHFQKRKMVSEVPAGEQHFYMIPNRFIPATELLTREQIRDWSIDRLYLEPLRGRAKRILNYAKQPEVFVRKLKEKMSL